MDSYLLKFILELSIFRVNCIYVFLETSQYVHARHLVNTVSAEFCTRKMVTIKKRAGVIPYIFSSSIALLSSLLSCTFYLLDLRTISSVNILEMT